MEFPRTALLVASLAILAVAVPAGAINAVPTWQAARVVALPSGATGLPQGYLPALSCPSAGNCVAGGAYADASGNTQGLLLEKVAGTWRSPKRLVAPVDAAANPAVTISALSCARARNCAVGGSYQEKGGNSQSFLASEVRGSWSGARVVVLPANAVASGQSSTVRSLSCASAGNCSAVGDYLTKTSPVGHANGYAVSEVRGRWGRAREIVPPTGANINPFVSINQLACSSAGNCSAVGSYVDVNGVTHGLTVNEVGGAWAPARPLALPGDANAFPGATLSEISCVSNANCTALGNYTNATGAIEGLAVTELSGQWGRAASMRMPTGAASNPHVFFYGFDGLSCPSLGNCSAGGQYRDGARLYQGFLVSRRPVEWGHRTHAAEWRTGRRQERRRGRGVVPLGRQLQRRRGVPRRRGQLSGPRRERDSRQLVDRHPSQASVGGHHRRGRRRRVRAGVQHRDVVHGHGKFPGLDDDLSGLHYRHGLIKRETVSGSRPASALACGRSRCPATDGSTVRCRGRPRPRGT
jgi:hypothetical protein